MFVTALLPVVVLLLIMPVGILGIVLFVVGLVKKKPAMWASGIVIGLLGLLALPVGMGMLWYLSAGRGSTPMMGGQATAVKSVAAQTSPFKERTGLDLPPGTVAVGRGSGNFVSDQDGQTQFVMLDLAVQPDFDEFLAANFTKAKWQDVAQTFQAGRSQIATFLPGDDQLQNMSLYVLTNQPDSNSPSTVTTVIAHDAGADRAWMVSVEKTPPATQP
jgi:phosphotransferase system  glucose/maltose/N-acetylglucosamine-specific IIC component